VVTKLNLLALLVRPALPYLGDDQLISTHPTDYLLFEASRLVVRVGYRRPAGRYDPRESAAYDFVAQQ
jgi:hypothetical protein